MLCRPLLLCLLLVFAAAVSPIGAQSTPPSVGIPSNDHVAIDIDVFQLHEPFRRAIAGNFSGDLLQDVVAMRGTRPRLLLNPSLYSTIITLPRKANDIARLPSITPGVPDEIAGVGGWGLRSWLWDSEVGQFVERAWASSAWQGSTVLRTADIDNTGDVDMVALNQNLVLMLLDPNQAPAEEGFPVTLAATSLELLDLDGDDLFEIALFGDDGVEIYSLDGTLLQSFASSGPGGGIAVVRQEGQPDRLAWFTSSGGSGEELRMIGQFGIEAASALGNLDFVAVTSGDVDMDGDDDLLVSHKDSYDLYVMINARDAQNPLIRSFAAHGGLRTLPTYQPAGPATGNKAWAIFVDLDNDQDLDVFYPIFSGDKIFLWHSFGIRHPRMVPVLGGVNYGFDPSTNTGQLRISLLDAIDVPAAATHVELTLWRKANIASTTEDTTIDRVEVPLSSGPFYQVLLEFTESAQVFDSIYFFTYRHVALDPQGNYLDVFPAKIMSFTTETLEEPGPIIDYLLGLPGAGNAEPVYGSGQTSGNFGLSSPPKPDNVGTLIPEKPIPDLPKDKEPVID